MAQEIITQEENITTADILRHSQKPDLRGPASAEGYEHDRFLPDVENFRKRWQDIQTGFVDEPKSSVEKADQLVASIIQQIAQVFADERGKLEGEWHKGGEVSTEDLRQALRRYRSFFDRLLTM
jgi:hypothetical protein